MEENIFFLILKFIILTDELLFNTYLEIIVFSNREITFSNVFPIIRRVLYFLRQYLQFPVL